MPGENLTRSEASERAAIITVESYDITLDLTTGPQTFSSRSRVRFSAEPGSSTFVDLIAPTVHSVVLNGVALDVTAVVADSRIALSGLAAENELVVEADCAYMTTGEGLHRFVDPVDDEVYLYSQFEVADSRRVFAVFEQPDLKATFAFTVTAPAHWTVISNSPTATPVPVAGGSNRNGGRDEGTATWTFEPTPRLASYVTAVVAGPYQGERGELTSSDGRIIPLGVYARASLAEHLDAEEIMAITRTGFAFFEELFGHAYPFTKYDQVFVPEFNAGAMENAGAVTFVESYVFRSKVTEATVERRAVTILHELAHMWFGDLVTMRWWDDLWLNESFAEFASTLATAEATRWSSAWTTFNSLEKSWAYRQDQLPTTHPIVADMRDLEDVEVNFDGITYAKGASVLKQLVAWVGRDAFIAGVRQYIDAHAWGNTELRDLLVELEAASGRELTSWSSLWLERSGVTLLRPVLEVSDGTDGSPATITRLAISQEVPAEHPVQRPHRLGVAGYTLVDGSLERTWRIELDIDGELTEVTEATGLVRPDLLLLNDDDLAYAKTRMDEHSLATAINHLGGFSDSLPRALVWSAVWDAVRDGETPASDFIDLILGNLLVETDSTVVLVLLRQLATCTSFYVADENRAALLPTVGDRLWQLAQRAEQHDTLLQLVKAFALYAETPEQLATVSGLLDGSITLEGLTVDVDLGWELLTSLVAAGAVDETAIDERLVVDPSATGQRAAAAARAAAPTPEAKERAWAAVVESDELANALQAATIAGFARAKDRELLVGFVERYFDALVPVWSSRTNEIAQNIVQGMYPAELAVHPTAELAARTDAWLAANLEAPAGLRRLVTEARDNVRRAVLAQQRDRARSAV